MSVNKNLADTIVIGGGITGLVAAWKIAKSGRQVILMEPGRLGGVVSTVEKNGYTLECGPNVFLAKEDFLSLTDSLGVASSIIYPTIKDYEQRVWSNGKSHVVPKNPRSFVMGGLLSLTEKLVALLLMIRSSKVQIEGDISVRVLCNKILGSGIANKIIDPVLRGIFGGDITQLSVRSLAPKVFDHFSSGGTFKDYLSKKKEGKKPDICVINGGNEQLVARLILDFKGNVSIVKSHASSIVEVNQALRYCVTSSDNKRYFADNLVISTSASATSEIIKGLDKDLCDQLALVPTSSLVVVHIGTYEIDHVPKKSFGILFPSTYKSPLMGIMFNSVLFPHMAPTDAHLLTVCLGGIGKEDVLRLSEEELERVIKIELLKVLGISKFKIINIKKWIGVIPQYNLNHYQLVDRLMQSENEHPGLYYCGADFGGVGVPDRISSAMRVANKITAQKLN